MTFQEGDQCIVCRRWFWERNGTGWHTLIPITLADHPKAGRDVICPSEECAEVTGA